MRITVSFVEPLQAIARLRSSSSLPNLTCMYLNPGYSARRPFLNKVYGVLENVSAQFSPRHQFAMIPIACATPHETRNWTVSV